MKVDQTMSHFPIFLNPKRQNVLLVGAGLAALAKLRLLLESGVHVSIVAPGALEAMKTAGLNDAETGKLRVHDRGFRDRDLKGRTLVYIATKDHHEENYVAFTARQKNIPVNVVDKPGLSDFITPAMIERGALRAAFSSGGEAPVFVRRLRAELERLLPQNLGRLSESAGRLRSKIKAIIPDATRRRLFWDELFDKADTPPFLLRDISALDQAVVSLAKGKSASNRGLIQLVGAGPGDPELLTLKAHRALQRADVIIYDKLVSSEVLSLARRDAEFIFVGKSKGDHGIGQDGINALLVSHARQGKRVIRLKAGDPMIFGRAGEEIDSANAAGIDLDVIPGIYRLIGYRRGNPIPNLPRPCPGRDAGNRPAEGW